MTRREERLERARQRAEEYRRKRKLRLTLFLSALALYVLVPLMWYGAIEFGLVRPIRTPEFKSAVSLASIVVLLVILHFLPEFYWKKQGDKDKKKAETQTSSPVTT